MPRWRSAARRRPTRRACSSASARSAPARRLSPARPSAPSRRRARSRTWPRCGRSMRAAAARVALDPGLRHRAHRFRRQLTLPPVSVSKQAGGATEWPSSAIGKRRRRTCRCTSMSSWRAKIWRRTRSTASRRRLPRLSKTARARSPRPNIGACAALPTASRRTARRIMCCSTSTPRHRPWRSSSARSASTRTSSASRPSASTRMRASRRR